MKSFPKKLLTLYGLCLFLTNNLYAQLSPYHGIVFPYDNPNRAVYSAGSLTYAAADYSANIQNNPVSFSYIQRPQIFLIINQDISRYYLTDIKINKNLFNNGNNVKEKNLNPGYKLNPGFISGTLPLNIANQRIFLSASLNKIQMPAHEIWLPSSKYPGLPPELDFHHQRDGRVWNGSINVGCQLPLNVNLGITWSKWFGSWNWYDHNFSQRIIGKGSFKYHGDNFGIGLLKKNTNLSICFCYYTPLTLMKADSILIKNMCEMSYTLRQKFNGAFKFGVASQLADKLILSVAFRYQNNFSVKEIMLYPTIEGLALLDTKYEYSSSYQIAMACEYIVCFKTKKVPIFVSYGANWLPKLLKKGLNVWQLTYRNVYQEFSKNSLLSHNFAVGIHFPFHLLNIHLASQLNIDPIQAIYLPNNYSHIFSPMSFNAKRLNFMFHFGVSYKFKK